MFWTEEWLNNQKKKKGLELLKAKCDELDISCGKYSTDKILDSKLHKIATDLYLMGYGSWLRNQKNVIVRNLWSQINKEQKNG